METVARVVRAVEFVAREGRVRLDDVAQELGVHKSNALRLLNTLRELDWMVLDDRRTYMVSPHLIAVGQAAAAGTSFQEALQLAEDLRAMSGETVHIAVPHGQRMLIVGRVESHNPLRVSCELGTRDALHASALGKAYLAALTGDQLDSVVSRLDLDALTQFSITDEAALRAEVARTKERGYSLDFEEGRVGVCCLGFSLRLGRNRDAVALSITGPSYRWTREKMMTLVPALLERVEAMNPSLALHPR
ncbi:MAG: IclR family transcriptional regulator [bacterium]|nr:IclR family transcriptional regulator [bacterium]